LVNGLEKFLGEGVRESNIPSLKMIILVNGDPRGTAVGE